MGLIVCRIILPSVLSDISPQAGRSALIDISASLWGCRWSESFCVNAISPLRGRCPTGQRGVCRLMFALFVRDIRLGLRAGGGALVGILFFLAVIAVVPFGVGPDLKLLARIGLGHAVDRRVAGNPARA